MIIRDDATHRSLTFSLSPAEQYFQTRYPGFRLTAFGSSLVGNNFSFCLEPEDSGVVCPRCGRYHKRFKDSRTVTIYDLDMLGGGPIKVEIRIRRHRCSCGCGDSDPMPDWVLPGHRVTKRLAAYLQSLMLINRISVADAAKMVGLDWALVKNLDCARLKPLFGLPDISLCRHLAIDEIAIHKGHRYATVFMDLENRQVLRVVQGKRMSDLRAVFEEFARDCPNLESVSVDMNAAFPTLVREYLPATVKIAYDLFHVMAHFHRDVLVEAKKFLLAQINAAYKAVPAKDRTKEMTQERDAQRALLCKAEWLVLKDPEELCGDRRDRLIKLREDNQLFADLYPLAALLRAVWKATDENEARTLLNNVIEICNAIADEHDFKAARKFANMLARRAEGIITAGQVGFGTNILEGANNTAKVIKRVAYGFQDFEYFSLKLKSAFPGKRFKLTQQGTKPAWELYWDGSVETLRVPMKT